MRMLKIIMPLALTSLMAGCDRSSNAFEMKVDQVDELKGFILKGISISGKITKGCIANEDEFIVKRKGKEVYKTTTRIVNVLDLKDPDSFNGKVYEGNYVTFYIPDGKLQEIQAGDMVVSNTISCKQEEAAKQ